MTTIAVSEATRDLAEQLAQAEGVPLPEVVRAALETYRRQNVLQEANAAYAAILADPAACAEMEQERSAWDATLSDGLESV